MLGRKQLLRYNLLFGYRMENISAHLIRRTSASSGILSNASIVAIIFLTWLLIYVPGLARPGLLDDADSVHA
jgi:hypothetical protein